MSGPAKARLSAELRRAAIIDAAVDLFSRRGFRGTTTRELAAAVGVSEPVLYQHFATKQSLYTAIIEANVGGGQGECPIAERLDELAAGDDSEAFLTLLAGSLLDFYLKDPRFARMLLYARLEEHELSDLFYERRVATFYRMLTDHLERQMERGLIRPMNSLLAARAFAGMVAHQGWIYCVLRPGDLPATRDEVVGTIVETFLRGVLK